MDDKIAATMIKRSIPFILLMEGTWGSALQRFSDLPDQWIHNCEVLVGSRYPIISCYLMPILYTMYYLVICSAKIEHLPKKKKVGTKP